MICTKLHCIRPVFVNIWRVERCVCFWHSCISVPTGCVFNCSSTVVTFSLVHACFTTALSCLWSCFLFCKLLGTCSVFTVCCLFIKKISRILHELYFLKLTYLLSQSLVFIAEKILKIGQYLTKIWTITKWGVFETHCIFGTMTLGLYALADCHRSITNPWQEKLYQMLLVATEIQRGTCFVITLTEKYRSFVNLFDICDFA